MLQPCHHLHLVVVDSPFAAGSAVNFGEGFGSSSSVARRSAACNIRVAVVGERVVGGEINSLMNIGHPSHPVWASVGAAVNHLLHSECYQRVASKVPLEESERALSFHVWA